MGIEMTTFEPYATTYRADLVVDGEPFIVLFRVTNETLDQQEIYDYHKETVLFTQSDTIRMEVERIFHAGKDETLEIARQKAGFFDRLLAHLIEHFITHEKKWLKKAKKTKIMANYKQYHVRDTTNTPPNATLLNETF